MARKYHGDRKLYHMERLHPRSLDLAIAIRIFMLVCIHLSGSGNGFIKILT